MGIPQCDHMMLYLHWTVLVLRFTEFHIYESCLLIIVAVEWSLLFDDQSTFISPLPPSLPSSLPPSSLPPSPFLPPSLPSPSLTLQFLPPSLPPPPQTLQTSAAERLIAWLLDHPSLEVPEPAATPTPEPAPPEQPTPPPAVVAKNVPAKNVPAKNVPDDESSSESSDYSEFSDDEDEPIPRGWPQVL